MASGAMRAARELLADAANKVGDEAITDIVLPTIERVIHGGVEMVDLAGYENKGVVRVLRVAGLGYRLRRMGLPDELVAIGIRFCGDFEKARIGGLTANYNGYSGGAKRSSEPERWAEAMDLLSKASYGPSTAPLTHDERVVLFGYVVFDVSAADLGGFVARCVSGDEKLHQFTTKLLLNKVLNKLFLFYEDWDYVQQRHANERN